MSIRNALGRVLPMSLRSALQRRIRSARFSRMSVPEIFDTIYRDGYWGKDADGLPMSGTGSHQSQIVDPYVEYVRRLLSSLGQPSVVDLGCGDFNVGRRLVDHARKFTGCDISETIIQINRQRFADKDVEFKVLNLSEDPLPNADVCLVRQVLQHLSNRDIDAFVRKINVERPYRFLIVTEHVARNAHKHMNKDKPTGPGTRVEIHSGVDLGLPPFSLAYSNRSQVLVVPQDSGGIEADIRTTVYKFQ